jgi:FkbM family methyltransferase
VHNDVSLLKSIALELAPFGLVERRRRRFRLRRLGLSISGRNLSALEQAVRICNFELWPKFLRNNPGWTLIDVGANEGQFVRAAITVASPGQIIAIEASPLCQSILAPLIAATPGAQLISAAAGSVAGTVEFNCTGNHRMSSVLQPRVGIEADYCQNDFSVVDRVTVPIVRLDDVIKPDLEVGLLKVDVQGYEMEVLRGAVRMLERTKALLVEVNFAQHYEGAVDFETLHSFLQAAGFRLFAMTSAYYSTDRPLWADAMYVRRTALT